MKDPRKTDLAGLSPADQPIPMRQQIAYAVSEIAVNPIYTITLTFLTFFYTDVLFFILCPYMTILSDFRLQFSCIYGTPKREYSLLKLWSR